MISHVSILPSTVENYQLRADITDDLGLRVWDEKVPELRLESLDLEFPGLLLRNLD